MDLRERPVSEIMQREVATLREDDQLTVADDVMRLGQVRHMPVLAGEKLVGIVSNRDLLAASLTSALQFGARERRAFLRSVEVREVMTKDVVSVGPDMPIAKAARILIERRIGCLPVVKGEELVGLVTETDLLRAAYLDEGEAVVDATATKGEVMSDWKERLDRELEDLRRLRDELRVKIHLGKKDAQDLWHHLERRMSELEAHARRAAQRTEAPLQELADASRHLTEELRRGYRDLRGRL
ncbi:MAG TPA: CBS domain-containing protein [Myxococcota bacterium]|nr:CBS domain-containing protein [Myxococcota bacterium]